MSLAPPGTAVTDVLDVLDRSDLRTVFQPVVDLGTGRVVAHEALLRGPAGPLEQPLDLIAAARARGLVARLDLACWSSSVARARALSPGGPPGVLLLNAEPEGLGDLDWAQVERVAAGAAPGTRIVLEITERAIAAHHAQLLETVARVRSLGWGIALDDVGASAESLAFLPLLDPDVVKLDVTLVQEQPSRELARVVHGVNDFAERRGCLVLAEGVEEERHVGTARALGARWGQGWLFGRPAQRPRPVDPAAPGLAPPPGHRGRRSTEPVPPGTTPWDQLAPGLSPREGPRDLLVELSRRLEDQALALDGPCVVVTTFQRPEFFTPDTRERYEAIAQRAGCVYAMGEGLLPGPGASYRVGTLGPNDPLRREWYVAVLGSHFHALLMAREADDSTPEDPRFDHVLTYRHDPVVAAVRILLARATDPGAATPGTG